MFFILGSDPLEYKDRVFHRRRLDLDGLKTPFQSTVLLYEFSVFGQSSCSDTLKLSTTQGGLEDIGSIHGSFRGAGAYDGVQLIDENNNILGSTNLVHHCLDPFLELSTILGAGNHQRQIKGDDLLVQKVFGDKTTCDLLSQPFGDGRFPDTGFADENRVVLGASTEDLGNSPNLSMATDNRIHLALSGNLCKISTKGLECGCFNILVLFVTGASGE